MKIKVLLMILFNLHICFSSSFAQTKIFNGKVLDENKNPVKNLTLRFISLGDITTTDSGEFEVEVPSNISSIELNIKDEGWTIISPLENILALPEDENFVSKIFVVFNDSSKGNKLNELASKVGIIERLLIELGSERFKENEMLNSILDKISKNYNLSKSDLESAIETKKKQEEIYTNVSIQLSNFSLKINNVNIFFGNINVFAADDIAALNELINSITHYNESFRNLKNYKFKYYNQIMDNWKNSTSSESYLSTVNYAIDEIHSPYILRLNETIVTLNKLNRGFIEDEDEAELLKKNSKVEIESVVKELNRRLPLLDKRIESLLLSLKLN